MSHADRYIVLFCRCLMRTFFRSVEVTGLENLPSTGGGLIVSWHPNGLVDPLLILSQCPRPVRFGARHGLFRWPALGWLMRKAGTVPIYRREDRSHDGEDGRRRSANEQSLDLLARAMNEGAFAVLFPEGDSHDEPQPLQLKSGAARLYHRALELRGDDEQAPVIIPVGLHYDHKGLFGSRVLIDFHPPKELTPELSAPLPSGASEEARRTRIGALTAELEATLREVVYGTESWDLHHAMHRTRKLVRAERAAQSQAGLRRPDMQERVLGFARIWRGYETRVNTHPAEIELLLRRIREYDAQLRALHVEDHELDSRLSLGTALTPCLLVMQTVLVYFLLPPILILGYLVNYPVAVGLFLLSKLTADRYKDEATIKLLLGAVAFPLAWLAAALLVAWGQLNLHLAYPAIPEAALLAGVFTFVLSAAGGALTIHYHRLSRETARAVRVRFTRARRAKAIASLRQERASIFTAVMELTRGLDLPGTVQADGRIVPATRAH